MELAESLQERERKKGKEESKDGDPSLIISRENEQAEQALMRHEEVLTAEFKSDCATEWNRRRLARVYASVDGEEFGREGTYRVDRFGCMEMYVGEFDEDPPSEPSTTELWELYLGGEIPADILKKERLDKELMRIGRHAHMKQLDETKRELDFAAGGPTVRIMFVGKRSKNTKKKNKKEIFFRKGGAGGMRPRRTPTLAVTPSKRKGKRNRSVKSSVKKRARKNSK